MRDAAVRCAHAPRTTFLVLLVAYATSLHGAPPADRPAGGATAGAVPAAPAVSGFARVDDTELRLAHGYLLRAPDAFKASQQNAIVLLTPQPLDPKKLDAAGTLLREPARARGPRLAWQRPGAAQPDPARGPARRRRVDPAGRPGPRGLSGAAHQ